MLCGYLSVVQLWSIYDFKEDEWNKDALCLHVDPYPSAHSEVDDGVSSRLCKKRPHND